ncbi:similar to Saccharomyces cerevisiae YCR057C PWP2 Conserved 90S pre-ribosomal component essential for proper endonucleolytic cleavage of the 35 S rRNA precursor at A0, A1, and A2 sites [Maudiozyma saulgeensis]|uniref:Similar to Saccharomyces cerevisiae YCR057C PWP2 Conserved 90S pre-ribosomal component essential for proper endonucleolytic cleavage of the 35 S rRNA at A0, A1, and A2 sites n=1 Tax=Maudiozyma saulgeensis TaxID=1789683 RepID=A0A1X7QY37_9SACH|nr:similar to Saccharomyces cerevisiae YCR057C PWP2 Conserved 90S pre-ribosomal component essential for proper endonucleolytic cleavage of the 35 S rRNA precursor at A0, A1, and A2 sites [Kazachstania saulgeensis]
MKSDFKFSNLLGTVYRQGNIVFSDDGKQLISPVGNRVSVFDLINNKSFTFEYEHRKNIATLDLNKQGTLLLSVDEDGRAILVNFKSRNVLHHFNFKDKCYQVKFSPDGKLFALATGRFLQIWKTPEVNQDRQFAPFVRYRIHAGHFQDILSLTWSPDSRFIISTSKDLTAKIWSIDSDEKDLASTTFAGHKDYVMGAFFSADQENIYTVSKDGALFIWEYSQKRNEGDEEDNEDEVDISKYSWRIAKKHFFYTGQIKVKCVTFHSKSNMLVVGFSNGEFRLYELPEFTLIQQLSMGQNPVNAVTINESGEWLGFGSSKLGQLLVYEWQSESYILKQQGHFDATNSLTYSPDGSRVVTAAEDGKIKVWDVASGFCLATFDEHTSSVTQVQFAKKGQVLFSSSIDGTVRAWDLIRYRNFRVFTAAERISFNSLAVDPSGEVVCAGSLDSFDIHVWSVQTGQLLDTLSGHEGPISALAFSQENSVLASASWDKTIRIWSIFGRSQQVEPIEVYSDVLALAIKPDGTSVAVSTLKGQITIFDIQEGKQIGNIDCRRDIISGRNLEDRFTAKNSERSKFFTTINYSFDGLAIVAGGNNNSICLYDVPNEVLLRRFIVSKNMTLNGTLEFLNSSKMTEAGSLDLIDEDGENSDLEDRIDNTLPGSRRGGDLSTRKLRPEVRVTSVEFSPTATAFAAASTEGLLIYSVDDSIFFDPFDLDVDVTPQSTIEALEGKEYLNALVMSFRLNEEYLVNKVYETIPLSEISLVANGVPVVYLTKLLTFIGNFALESQHVEFNLIWIKNILSAHGNYINLHKNIFVTPMRAIQRFIGRIAKEVTTLSMENKYTYRFLTSTDGTVVQDDEEVENLSNDEDTADEEDAVLQSDEDDEEGWVGFEGKDNKLPLENEDESSDEELI